MQGCLQQWREGKMEWALHLAETHLPFSLPTHNALPSDSYWQLASMQCRALNGQLLR